MVNANNPAQITTKYEVEFPLQMLNEVIEISVENTHSMDEIKETYCKNGSNSKIVQLPSCSKLSYLVYEWTFAPILHQCKYVVKKVFAHLVYLYQFEWWTNSIF